MHSNNAMAQVVAESIATATLQKTLGAYYTEKSAAERIVAWAVRDGTESVLDPSCGDGVFLDSALLRLRQLGCDRPALCGVDISVDALRLAHERVENATLINQDFFSLTAGEIQKFDCIVGNPPFIRYQTFNGNKDSLGHQRAKEAGVNLPRLASSWAPFVVHACCFLRRGGRLGMVMPAELGHAMYARDILRFLVDNFRQVAVEMFRDKLFEDLSQSTVLLLCEGYGETSRDFIVSTASNLGGADGQITKVDIARIRAGRFRFSHYVVSDKVRSLYEGLAAEPCVQRLGDVADVSIGYVTGANDFFHLSAQETLRREIPKRYLRPCLMNLRAFEGIEYNHQDWKTRRTKGEKVYLLALPPVHARALPPSVQAYLKHGESQGVPERYKCRVREFWHSVPHIRVADAFLSYMSGDQPLLVANVANLVAPNTIHILRFGKNAYPLTYAVSWRSSLTRLSCEFEGHALGGGLFKLEPSEAENVLIVRPSPSIFRSLIVRFNKRRTDSSYQFFDAVDQYVLRRQLGLSDAECILLREAAGAIESWRKHK
jgi:adenine-specific DNA-methyltransferase